MGWAQIDVSLVRELEAKRAIDKKQLMEVMTKYLRSVGADVVQGEEPTTDMFGANIIEPVIQLKDDNIDRVRLVSPDYISYWKREK